MAVKYLSGNRIWGTNAERLAMTTTETKSADFDGSADYVTPSGSAADYNFLCGYDGGSFSIACWIKPNAQNNDVLFDSFGYDGNNTGFGARFNSSGGSFTLHAGISIATVAFPTVVTDAIWANEWCHLTITYDSSTMKIYRNGEEEATGTITSTDLTPTFVFRIGEGNGGDNPYEGYMSDLLLTNDVLSADEIEALASGTTVDNVRTGSDAPIGNQELHYTFFTDFTDSSGEGRNGTATNVEVNTDGGTLPLTSEYPNLPNGTVFITSDTNVHYMWNGTDTWNLVA